MKYAIIIGQEITQTLSTPFLHIECEEDVTDITHYYDEQAHEIVHKKSLQIDVDIKQLTVTVAGLPTNLTVETNNMSTITDNTPLVIDYDISGTYTITLSGHVEFLDHEMEVTVGNA